MNPFNPETTADRVLIFLRKKIGQPVEPKRLVKELKCSPENVVEAISELRSWGYTIKADRNGRYTLTGIPDSYLSAEIAYHLGTKMIGRKIYAYQTVQSTNTIAAQLAAMKAPEGTLVIAEYQTRGRGRLGREWHSPEKVGLYCSLILYPKIHPTQAPGISLMTAVALAETINSYDDIDVKIKWPNDVLISGMKAAGILTELSAELDRVEYVIVGVGVNLNQKRSDFPPELRETATSVRIGTKEKVNRREFLQRFLRNFEKEYFVFRKSGLKEARKSLLRYSALLNQEIKLKMGRKTIIGTVIDIDALGRLVLDTREGIIPFNAGEVSTH